MRCDRAAVGAALALRPIAAKAAPTLVSNHVNKLAVFRPFTGELDLAVFFREQRVVATDADVHARMKMRATLANDNVAGNNFLAAVDLDAQPFAL